MRILLIVLSLMFCYSCHNNDENKTITPTELNDSIVTDSIVTDSVEEDEYFPDRREGCVIDSLM